jgi:tyrosyl-tRNA synthetase
MSDTKNKEVIDEILTRGVGDFIDPDGSFRKKLIENPNKVVIKFGVDPTRPDIHLGHAVVLRKLRKFQDMGCKVIFLIGDITALIGDPSGKSKVRPEVEQAEVQKNMETYLAQVGKILLTDEKVFSWTKNSDWLLSVNDVEAKDKTTIKMQVDGKEITLPELPHNNVLVKAFVWETTRMQKGRVVSYSFLNVLSILRKVTYGRLISRDLFQDRIKEGGELYMHEMLYPILQGIDSSALAQIYGSCDLEVGGTDQTFNMLMGRDIMKINKQEQQAVLAFELLVGTDGKEKMSKSLDNYIAITDEPNDMYGKVMSVPDALIPRYFTLCTYTPTDDITSIEETLKKGKENPKDIKMRLAREIVEMYHGKQKSKEAEEAFVNTFSKKGIPESVPEVEVSKGTPLIDVLVDQGLITSKGEFRRLIESGAVEHMEPGNPVSTIDFAITESGTYRIGKKRFIKIIIS